MSGWRVFSREPSAKDAKTTVLHLTRPGSTWRNLADGRLATTSTLSPAEEAVTHTPGASSHAFHSALIPIPPDRSYHLNASMRQSGTSPARNFLAVAWYDGSQRLLYSNLPAPEGAGAPWGWANGSYSYFGLVGVSASSQWTRYMASFGLGQRASIPANAVYLRVGALLNNSAERDTKVEVSHVSLLQVPSPRKVMVRTDTWHHLHTPSSQSAQLAHHWLPDHAATLHAGERELRSAASLSLHAAPQIRPLFQQQAGAQ